MTVSKIIHIIGDGDEYQEEDDDSGRDDDGFSSQATHPPKRSVFQSESRRGMKDPVHAPRGATVVGRSPVQNVAGSAREKGGSGR